MSGIYIASKTKHADRWRCLRDDRPNGIEFPICSTWIDEAGEGESSDLSDLWQRCIHEASHADVLVAFQQDADETWKGAFIEIGAALSAGVPVIVIGPNSSLSFAHHPLVSTDDEVWNAMIRALNYCNALEKARSIRP